MHFVSPEIEYFCNELLQNEGNKEIECNMCYRETYKPVAN